jgi:hypothetical protein
MKPIEVPRQESIVVSKEDSNKDGKGEKMHQTRGKTKGQKRNQENQIEKEERAT